MKWFLLVYFLLAIIYWKSCQNAEVRNFALSQVSINNSSYVTLTTQSSSASFFIIGDWGGLPIYPYHTPIETKTSKLMDQLSKTYGTQFQLALGDNFYFNGVKDVNDKQFQKTFENVFDTDYLRNNPWFVLLGNHDHYGNVQAQIDYTKKSKRWIMPSHIYNIDVKVQNGQKTLITIMMMDSVQMCGLNPIDGLINPQNYNHQVSDAYFAAFEKQLAAIAATKVPYIIVAGHYPVWSIAQYGSTQCLIDKLRPLLHKYGVSAYLAGHDHDLQHLRDTYLGRTVDYIVSGCADFITDSTAHMNTVPANSLKFHWGDDSLVLNGGFVVAQATTSSLTLTFYETTGKSLYQTTIKPRF